MRRFIATIVVVAALLVGGCSAPEQSPSAPPSSAEPAAPTASPPQSKRQLPNLSQPTDESVKAFGDILVEWTLGMLPEERVRPKFPYFNVDPDSSTCPGPNEMVVVSSGQAATHYCSDGTLMYSLEALSRRAAKAEPDSLVIANEIMKSFGMFLVQKLQARGAKDPELTDANYAFCADGYVHGGLIKGRYINSEHDLGVRIEKAYPGNLSAQRVYHNARDNGECRDPGPVGESQPGDRANVDVPDLCSLVDKEALQRETTADRDVTIQGGEGGRTDKAPMCYMVFQGDAGRWESRVIKLENNVAAMQLCASERAGFTKIEVFDRPGGVMQVASVGGLDWVGMACIRNYWVSVSVTREGWTANKMADVLDTTVARINSHA